MKMYACARQRNSRPWIYAEQIIKHRPRHGLVLLNKYTTVKNRSLSASLDDSYQYHSLALRINELQHGHDVLIKLVQSETFSQELDLLSSNQGINKSSKLLNLSPFIDMKGIIRVGGRLRNANLSLDKLTQ